MALTWPLGAALLLAAGPAMARSPFAVQGIVEGEYGPPWDHAARGRTLAFMAAHGLNTYIHAPKDDPYQRARWRDPYPAAEQAEFDAEIRFARRHGIQWVPNLDPALPEIPTPGAPSGAPSPPICFSCAADLQALLDKFAPFARAGARTFMVCSPTSSHC